MTLRTNIGDGDRQQDHSDQHNEANAAILALQAQSGPNGVQYEVDSDGAVIPLVDTSPGGTDKGYIGWSEVNGGSLFFFWGSRAAWEADYNIVPSVQLKADLTFLQAGGNAFIEVDPNEVDVMAGTTANGLVIKEEGTFVHGALMANDLPTSDPHVLNQVWNSAGTLKISAGP